MVPNLYSFAFSKIPTSVSIPFIIFYGWMLKVCNKHENLYVC
jgi:hypothetical protein